MAFSNTVISKIELPGGIVEEHGTWLATAGTTTGTITADTTSPGIKEIREWYVSSNGDTAVKPATDAGLDKLKLTFTANDGGRYVIVGQAH